MATAAAAVAARQRRLARHFTDAGATEPDKAISYTPRRRIDRRFFESLVEHGALVEARPGAWWMDEARYSEFRRRRRKRALTAVSAVLATGAVIAALLS